MYSPTTRVLTVLEFLQAHGRLSGPDLAQRLAVDGRTLRRYIRRLEELGIPVLSERGRYGCYSLMPGFKLPPMVFTDDEALAIALGLVAARGLAVAGAAVESAQAKLERVMPGPLKQRVRALGETVALDRQPSAMAQDSQTLMAFSLACYQCQQVHVRYGSAHLETTQRDFDPYGLAYRGHRWYVVGYCHLRDALRSLRLDRVLAVESRAHRFVAPANFDAVRHLALGVASIPRAVQIEVLLYTDMETARKALFDSIGLLHPADGGIMLHSQADDVDWFARELARLPFSFEIRQPAGLRAALSALAQRLQQLAAVVP
ncbi:YafY family protein [Rhodoferax sp.]|uniref:helix-turn-helix transcriptional regulator n=1 Tax=Rhodoferax sp. TaxID=50421 RepID=UPI0025F69C15|nr:YafY family protein [Rhodoferax sp.]